MGTQPFNPIGLEIMRVPEPQPIVSRIDQPLSGALRMIALGVPVAPIQVLGKKFPPIEDFPNLATTNEVQVNQWAQQMIGCNWACVARSDEYCFLDEDDSDRIRALYEKTFEEAFPRTWTTESQPGHRQSAWKQTDATRKLGNRVQQHFKDGIASFRQNGEYVLAAMSHLNPDAEKGTGHRDYMVVDDSPIVAMPENLIDLIYSLLIPADQKTTAKSLAANPEAMISEHYRNDTLFRVASKWRENGTSEESIRFDLQAMNEERCNPRLSREEVDGIVDGICKRYEKGDPARDVIIFNSAPSLAKVQPAINRPDWVNDIKIEQLPSDDVTTDAGDEIAEKPENTHRYYDMTPEEIAVMDDEDCECPVYRLHPTPGPEFDEGILYGPLGQITKMLCFNTEAHVGTVYLNLIVSFGNMFGRGAYFNVGSTKHYTNEYLACIGSSATGRKGLAADLTEGILTLLDGHWMSNRNPSGFSTNQAVISHVRDAMTFQKWNQKAHCYETITKPGVEDKRLCIREGEASNVFKLLADAQQKAGETIRNAWDGKSINNLVAGKTDIGEHNSLTCKEPHISIIGSSTPSLVKATLPVGVATSGDGNRFLWCYTKRNQLVPRPPEPTDWASETIEIEGVQANALEYFLSVVYESKKPRLMALHKSARKTWDYLYARLENDQRDGFLGGMTSRASAHIRRIATILALIDRDSFVWVKHIQAAEAVYNYTLESARYIFSGYTQDQAKILRLAEEAGETGITAKAIHELFSRNKQGTWVQTQLSELAKNGFLTKTKAASTQGYEVDTYYFKKW